MFKYIHICVIIGVYTPYGSAFIVADVFLLLLVMMVMSIDIVIAVTVLEACWF